MSYQINKTNGEELLTLLDGTLDTSTGLNLVGKNYVGYGELQQENFVWLLENFANDAQPTSPLEGQLWFNNATNVLNVYDGARFRPVSTKTVSNTAPLNSYVGDSWWDTANDQYKVYNGSGWSLIGPAYSKVDGVSGTIVESLYDGSGTKHTVMSIYFNNNRTAIVSYDQEFTPNVSVTGFTTIKPGINMSTANANNLLHGTAVNAQQLGNVAAVSYARKDQTETFAANVNVLGRVSIGTDLNGKLSTDTNGVVLFENTSTDKSIKIQTNPGGSTVDSLTVDGITGNVSVRGMPTTPLGVATKGYVDLTKSQVIADLESNIVTVNTNINSNVDIINANIGGLTVRMDAAEQDIVDLFVLDSAKATIDSPTFTGVPAVPTATLGTNTTQIASTAYVLAQDTERKNQTNSAIQANVSAINIDMTNRLALKANLASPTLTGVPTAPNPGFGANTQQIATTQFVQIATKYWDGSRKFISTDYPDANQGTVGDFWFRIES